MDWALSALAVATIPAPPFHCASCGYDLTANASGICPECGTALKPTTGNSEQDS